ncbi:MAG: AAA family ATPase [Chloroflexota bacterium]
MIILFSGVPATGKTALARAVAQHYQLPILTRDALNQFLYMRELISENTIDSYLLMLELATQFADVGTGVVLEGVFPRAEFRQTARTIATQHNMPFYAIQCIMSDHDLWKKRWQARRDAGSQSHWMTFTWDDVLQIKSRFEAWDTANVVTVDAINSIDSNLARILAHINNSQTTL